MPLYCWNLRQSDAWLLSHNEICPSCLWIHDKCLLTKSSRKVWIWKETANGEWNADVVTTNGFVSEWIVNEDEVLLFLWERVRQSSLGVYSFDYRSGSLSRKFSANGFEPGFRQYCSSIICDGERLMISGKEHERVPGIYGIYVYEISSGQKIQYQYLSMPFDSYEYLPVLRAASDCPHTFFLVRNFRHEVPVEVVKLGEDGKLSKCLTFQNHGGFMTASASHVVYYNVPERNQVKLYHVKTGKLEQSFLRVPSRVPPSKL